CGSVWVCWAVCGSEQKKDVLFHDWSCFDSRREEPVLLWFPPTQCQKSYIRASRSSFRESECQSLRSQLLNFLSRLLKLSAQKKSRLRKPEIHSNRRFLACVSLTP